MLSPIKMYEVIQEVAQKVHEARVLTKYKIMEKKVLPIAAPLPRDSEKAIKEAAIEPMLIDPRKVGHVFTPETIQRMKIGRGDFLLPAEEKQFKEMLKRYGKAFTFQPEEIGCVDPKILEPMVIFTIPHIPWNFKPIPMPRARIPQLLELLKEKIRIGILEPSNAPYSSRWFIVLKKDG